MLWCQRAGKRQHIQILLHFVTLQGWAVRKGNSDRSLVCDVKYSTGKALQEESATMLMHKVVNRFWYYIWDHSINKSTLVQ